MYPIYRNIPSVNKLTEAWNAKHSRRKAAYVYNKRHTSNTGNRGWYAVYPDGSYTFIAKTWNEAMHKVTVRKYRRWNG